MATSPLNSTSGVSQTDVLFQEINLYIEGVQVPFIAISVTNSIGDLPRAAIQIPPQTGILEITRSYQPKVHIFFIDPTDQQEKVLFSGIIESSNFDKSAAGSTSVTLNCVHRYQLFREVQADYSGWMSEVGNAHPNEGAVQSTAVSSKYAMQLAMTGIFRDTSEVAGYKEMSLENVKEDQKNNTNLASSAVLPSWLTDYKNRMIGIPGVLLNYWQQLKYYSYLTSDKNEIMIKCYIPLVEEGMKFFQRMSGHYFIEDLVEKDRIQSCADEAAPAVAKKKMVVAPSMRLFTRSAVQTDLSVQVVQNQLQFSGESTGIYDIFAGFLQSFDYDMLILASPAEVPQDPTQAPITGNFTPSSSTLKTAAVDVIIKPQTPFYYSPICNVIYPNMISSISTFLDDYNVPTRITLKNTDLPATASPGTHIRAPASVREAIANKAGTGTKSVAINNPTSEDGKVEQGQVGVNTTTSGATTIPNSVTVNDVPNLTLAQTFGTAEDKLGKYEQGRGVKHIRGIMPNWLKYYTASANRDKSKDDGWPTAEDGFNFEAIQALSRGWATRYKSKNVNLNPWEKASGLSGYQRLLVAHADYEYSMAFSRARVGSANLIFNPYLTPGYPMDIIDATPNHPSYHAFCTSVTHSITQDSISTSCSFVSTMTYTELANYFLNPIHPWLQYALGLAERQTLMDNPDAKAKADEFYFSTLGVRAVAPTDLFDMTKGQVKPVKRIGGGGLEPGTMASNTAPNGGELNPMLTGTGNLTLAMRPIETRKNVEDRWSVKFIEMKQSNYNTTAIKYKSVNITYDALEPGQSQWLDYHPMFV